MRKLAVTFFQASETHKHSEVLKSESLYITKSGRHDPKTSGLFDWKSLGYYSYDITTYFSLYK